MSNNYWTYWRRFNRKFKRLSFAEKMHYLNEIRNTDCILIDTPVHGNLGDHAIVQAQKQIINMLGMSATEIPQIELKGRERVFSKIIPKDKVILIPGGGFLGSLWPNEEYEVRNILDAFPENRIIVFPQTVYFDDSNNVFLEESKRAYSGHKHLSIFVRDKKSFDYMKKNMPDVDVTLVPDSVTAFIPDVRSENRETIMFFFRNDKEKIITTEIVEKLQDIVQQKWPIYEVVSSDTVLDGCVFPNMREKSLNEKLAEFSAAKLVVTDRLHGMIFSAITSTPCIAFDNANGKVREQYEWIKDNDFIHLIDDWGQIEAVIDSIDLDKTEHYDDTFIQKSMAPLYKMLEQDIKKLR